MIIWIHNNSMWNIPSVHIAYKEYSVKYWSIPHNIVMDPNNVMGKGYDEEYT